MYWVTTDGNANQVLKTDGSGNLSWTDMSSGGGGASALNDLSDVSISSLSSGQVLKYNGSNWVNDTDNTGSGGGGGGSTYQTFIGNSINSSLYTYQVQIGNDVITGSNDTIVPNSNYLEYSAAGALAGRRVGLLAGLRRCHSAPCRAVCAGRYHWWSDGTRGGA